MDVWSNLLWIQSKFLSVREVVQFWLGVIGELAITYIEECQIQAITASSDQLEQWFWYVNDLETKCKTEEIAVLDLKQKY